MATTKLSQSLLLPVIFLFLLFLLTQGNSNLARDLNSFNNCHLLLYSVGPHISTLSHQLSHIRHPIQLTQPPLEELISNKWNLIVPQSSFPKFFAQFLPDFQPQTKAPLECKLLIILIADSFTVNHFRMLFLPHVERALFPILGHKILRLTTFHEHFDNYATYFRRNFGLIYLDEDLGGTLQVQGDVFRIIMTNWSPSFFQKYHIHHFFVMTLNRATNERNLILICTLRQKNYLPLARPSLQVDLRTVVAALIRDSWQFSAWKGRGGGVSNWAEATRFSLTDRENLVKNRAQHLEGIIVAVLQSYLGLNSSQVVHGGAFTSEEIGIYPNYPSGSSYVYSKGIVGQIYHPFFWINVSLSIATCFPVEEFVTFYNYLTPFDPST